MEPHVDLVIAGKYRLLRKLGQGGMGSVWQAEHLTLRSQVAIKLIDASLATTPDAVSRFLREAQSAASLRSPHVVQVLDHGVDEGTPYIAMELLDGESLGDRLQRMGQLTPADTARILVQVGRAVGRAHDAGIVHRDLKPDNVFLVQNDDEEIAKVLDFGIAKLRTQGLELAASGATRTGALLGTPYYMSPEQAEGVRSLDHRSDIWALGVIAFECLLGRRPFDGETVGSLILAVCSRPMPVPSEFGPVPLGFDAWFARACCRSVSDRFASAREASAELKRVCGEGGLDFGGPVSFGAGGVPSSALDVSRDGRAAARTLAASMLSQPAESAGRGRVGVILAGVIALVGVGAFIWMRAGSTPGAEPVSGASAAVSAPLAVPEAPLIPSAVPTAAPAIVPSAPAAEPSASAALAAPAPKVVHPVPARPKAPAAEPSAAPPAKPKINLGI